MKIQFHEDGTEFWSARELAVALDYTQWRNFTGVINRAMIACKNSGHDVFGDFAEVSKIVEAGATSKPVKDYELSRYAEAVKNFVNKKPPALCHGIGQGAFPIVYTI